MRKILVTGSNGLVGQKLVEILSRDNNIEIIASSKNPDRNPGNTFYKFELLDITDKASIEYLFSKHQPEIVINCAAITQADYCEENKTECWNTNVEAVKYLCDASNKYSTKLIHLSSDFVFNGIRGYYKEEDSPDPVSFYGLSKWEAEKTVMEYANKWSIVRTILVYGVLKNPSRSNLLLWVIKNLSEKKQINVVTDQYRMPTLAEDLANAIKNIAMGEMVGLFHISGNEQMSIYEIACRTADFFKLYSGLIKPIQSIELNEKAKRPPKTGFCLDKSYRELCFRPASFNEGLQLIKKQINFIN